MSKKEVEEAKKQFDAHDENIKQMTLDRMNQAPVAQMEPQTKLSQADLAKSKEIYLKPRRQIGSREKFNEDYRKDYEFQNEMVRFVAENKEIIGESIELWTKPFAGMPCQEWVVPVNKPVWGPRHLAERIAGCKYHRFVMQQDTITSADGMGTYHGGITVDTTIPRLEAIPAKERKSIFMGAHSF